MEKNTSYNSNKQRKQTSNRQLGRAAELHAAKELYKQGYTILHIGYQSGHLETDIIASIQENNDLILCFIECKYRKAALPVQKEMAFASVGITKQKKLIRAAKFFLAKNESFQHAFCRFDVIIMLNNKNNSLTMHHYKNAFREE